MKDQPSAYSPFAALDTREKMDQWIWWQCQHPTEVNTGTEIEPRHLPELKRKEEEETVPEAKPEPPRSMPVVMPPVRHGQYDAVIRRMNTASKQATSYIPWSGQE